MKPMLIAVTSRNKVVQDLPAYYVFQEYLQALQAYDAGYIIIAPSQNLDYAQIAKLCDGLLLCGGSDINPYLYKEKTHIANKCADEKIDMMDFALIKAFQKEKKPILGICRGMQAINVCLNGTLTQDISSMLNINEPHNQKSNRNQSAHIISTKEHSLIRTIVGNHFAVNSFHHQCIHLLGDGLSATAYSDEGIIEAIEGPLILGVQWHPESMEDAKNKAIFEYFIKQCKESNYVQSI